MLWKEKDCTRMKRSCRKFLEKPAAALALVNPAAPPKESESIAMSTRIRPIFRIAAISTFSPFFWISLMR